MSRDLAQFLLPLSTQGEPGLSPIDTRLNTITDLAEQRKFKESADHVEKLLEEQIYDIRPISILFFQAFLEDGFSTLSPIFLAMIALLGDNAQAVGPLKRREDQFNRRMIWLFDSILDAIKYHQTKHTEDWDRWSASSSPEQIQEANQHAQELTGSLSTEALKGAHTALGRVMAWLRSHHVALVAARSVSPSPASPATIPPAAAASPPSLRSPVVSRESTVVDAMVPVRRKVELEVSHQFIELWVKLRAFEALIEQKKLDRAALVGQDLMSIIENFDPRAFFPELFARFSALMSRNINALSAYTSERDSEQWKAMEQHYRVDLEGFLKD